MAMDYDESNFVKFVVYFTNFLYYVMGVALIIIGVMLRLAVVEFTDIVGTHVDTATIILIVAGAVILLIAIVETVGLCRENHVIVFLVAGLLLVLFLSQVIAGILTFHWQDEVIQSVENGLTTSMDSYRTSDDAQLAWDAVQDHLKCCGIKDSTDWAGKGPVGLSYPTSCCKPQNRIAPCGVEKYLAYQPGCLTIVENFIANELFWAGVIGVLVTYVQLAGIVLTFYHAYYIYNSK